MNEGRNQTLSCEVGAINACDRMKENAEEKWRSVPEMRTKIDSPAGHERAWNGSREMKGAQWMDIRSDRQKGLRYVVLGWKYHMDPQTAKRYARSAPCEKTGRRERLRSLQFRTICDLIKERYRFCGSTYKSFWGLKREGTGYNADRPLRAKQRPQRYFEPAGLPGKSEIPLFRHTVQQYRRPAGLWGRRIHQDAGCPHFEGYR